LLNVGCGHRFHNDWTNIDLESTDPSVQQHDITKGLPFEDQKYDAVYHSHVLEHLDPTDGDRLLEECYRVLKPGGVLRIVIPNLEQIATLYLENHRRAWEGDEVAAVNYDWMKLELLDQLVRNHSGGRMGPYMAGDLCSNSKFVQSRVGDEFARCQNSHLRVVEKDRRGVAEQINNAIKEAKAKFTRWVIRRLMGKEALRSFEEGLFRSQGEIHRWMYDRHSLRQLCHCCGFVNFKVQSATASFIEGYETFELDAHQGNVRKPDSLFVECRRPSGIIQERNAA
jgi:SAM-dependent methyltransferase